MLTFWGLNLPAFIFKPFGAIRRVDRAIIPVAISCYYASQTDLNRSF